MGSPDALRPPLPPLDRYKRDVALRLQSQDGGGWAQPAGHPAPRQVSRAHMHCLHGN